MSRINTAYAVLSDSRRRAQYDSELKNGAEQIAQASNKPGWYGEAQNAHARRTREISWLLFSGCVAAIYFVILEVYGVPTERAGHIGTTLLLTNYAGRTLGVIMMGAVVVAIISLVNRLQRRSYETPKRDLLIASFVSCYLMLFGDNRTTTSSLYLCALACLGLIYWPRVKLPKQNDLSDYLAGSAILALPIGLIAGSTWLANYSIVGALVGFVLGAVILLYLLLRRPASGHKEP